MRLVFDIGGTKTNVAIVSDITAAQRPLLRYESQGYGSLQELVLQCLSHPQVIPLLPCRELIFAVAGPVEDLGKQGQFVRPTNLAWTATTEQVRTLVPGVRVVFVNDFVATARRCASYAISMAKQEAVPDVEVLYGVHVSPEPSTIAVMGVGTGLGESFVKIDRHRCYVFPSEGGHTDFAPCDEVEVNLWRFLQQRYGSHVSYERILSGAGITDLYLFFTKPSGGRVSTDSGLYQHILQHPKEAPALIVEHALRQSDEACVASVERFLCIYGAKAGNLALSVLPTHGVFLCGGIIPKLLPLLRQSSFLQRYVEKGRLAKRCEGIPVYVVTNPLAPIDGAIELVTEA